jgi:hypothetical protein
MTSNKYNTVKQSWGSVKFWCELGPLTVQILIEEIHTQPGISKTNSPPAGYLSTTDLSYSKDVTNEPGHAETVQLLIKEIHTQPGISKTNSPS